MKKQVLQMTNMTWLTVTILLMMVSLVTCVTSPPRIDQHPTGLVVNMSDPVTLECRASGEPKPRITWYKDGQQLSFNTGDESSTSSSNKYTLIHDSNLFIFSAAVGKGNRSDSGVYYCRAENEHGLANSQTAHLIVAYLREDFREVPKSRQVNSGVSVSMECKAPKGYPEPLVTWERNGQPIQPSVLENNLRQKSNYQVFGNGSLIILNATLLDAGDYVCVAQNDAGFRYSSSATLSVFERPSFVIQPEASIKLAAQTRAEIKCQATGYPRPQIEWKKDNSVENLPIKAQITDANVLVIPNLSLDDEGEYTCVASNQLGFVESQTSYLYVFEKPTFTKHMSNHTVGIEGKSLTIECNARGRPQPVIYWAKSAAATNTAQSSGSAATLMTTQDDFIILENGNLFIEKLSAKYEGTYMCQASNEHGVTEAKTTLEVRPVQSKPPPLVIYWPQNQTIPINTQASLECFAASPGNIVVMGGVDMMINPKEEKSSSLSQPTERISIAWYKNGIKVDIDPLAGFDAKFRMLESGTLEINSVSKTDSGVYKCEASNAYGRTYSKTAFLNIENPNNQYVEFKRNFETTALPSAPPVQPFIRQITTKSVTLHWQPSSHSGHSPIRSYTIEYFSPEWPNQNGWITLAEDVVQTTLTVNSLQPDTYYMFVVRARNDQGYGPPSHPSDMIRTAYEPHHHHHLSSNKQTMSEMLEKALTGEIVQLNEPVQVLGSTSVNITWKVLKSAYLIEGFYLKYKPVGSGVKEYHTEKLKNKQHVTSHVVTNLHKYTMYEFLVEPFAGEIRGSESNLVQCRTGEDVPSHAPLALQIEMNTLSSITIRWQPPAPTQLNGALQGFKIVCLANETRFNVNVNANASNRAILLGNLVEGMRYCVRVAALTRVGIGPYTASKCVEMTTSNLELAKKRHEDKSVLIKTNNGGYFSGLTSHAILSQMWFVSLLGVLAILGLGVIFYLVWCLLKRRRASFMRKGSHHNHHRHHKKYLSASSEECSLNRNLNKNNDKKVDHNRYKLVNDTVWLDTLHSNSNNSNPECCCVPDLVHHQLYAKQNCSNMHLIHDLSGNHLSTMEKKRLHNLSIKSKYCTSHHLMMAQQTEAANMAASLSSNGTSSSSGGGDSGAGPQYAEIYAPLQHHPPPPPPPLVMTTSAANSGSAVNNNNNGGPTNPYATTGLFLNHNMENSNGGNFYNLLSNNIHNNNVLLTTLNDNSSSNNINNPNDPSNTNNLIKYIHRQTSQSNTPRMSTRSHHLQHHNVMPANVLDSNNCVIIQTEQGQNVLLATLPVHSAATLRNYGGVVQQQQQQQQQNLIDEYITNAILAQNHHNQQLHLVNSPPTNLTNLIATSTLSRNGGAQIGSFTAQQYLNRSINKKYQQSAAQQDYSSIGADEDEEEDQHQQHEGAVLLNANGLPLNHHHLHQHLHQQQQHHQSSSKNNNNSISTSSYDESSVNRSPTTLSPGEQSTQSSGFSSSKRSSKSTTSDQQDDVKKRAMTTTTTTATTGQHYANGDEIDTESNDKISSNKKSSSADDELFISEMPQTIL